ncbi:hypothetical protein ACFU9K_47510, partial [Streptomyces sp. NPDC057582]
MTETAVENQLAGQVVQAPSSAVSDEQLVAMLVDRARNEGLQLTGEGGLLQQLTKRVLESTLESGLSCRIRGSLTWADTQNTPYPGYVSTCDSTKR